MLTSFLNISDLSKKQLISLLDLETEKLVLQNKSIGLLFEKYSTRTRLSFSVGVAQLAGNIVEIRLEELNLSRDESFEDTFLAFNCYLDGLIYRTSDHNRLIESTKFFKKPVINALSDLSHPCQTISDLYTLKEEFHTLDLHILWLGDMNNVCFSLVEAVNLLDNMKLTICSPRLISSSIKWKFNSNIDIHDRLDDLKLNDVDCVMTDVHMSMNDIHNKEKMDLLKPYIVNQDLMSRTSNRSIFMHCLPAKVGNEVSKEVFYSSNSKVWKQAYNRMIAQKKLLQMIDWI